MSKTPIRITRFHHTDLVCAAMNDTSGDTQRILDRMTEDPGFQIDEEPVPGVFYHDASISFMYPHEIKLADIPPDDIARAYSGLVPPNVAQHYLDLESDRGLPLDKFLLNLEYGKSGAAGPLITGDPRQLHPIQDHDDYGPDPTQDDVSPTPRKEPSALLAKLLSRL